VSAPANSGVSITPDQAAEERSLLFALSADSVMISALILVGFIGGSLTIVAEALRAVLMISTEVFAFVLMRRLHRGRLGDLEFGTGKLEQVASFLIGGGMLAGAAWILNGSFEILHHGRSEGTPVWLAIGAIIGAVNVVLNIVTWDNMRRAVGTDTTLVMLAQLKARTVKLLASAFVLVTLTIAALANDAVVVATSDAVGSGFVACFIAFSAIGMLKNCVPDLLDRSAGKDVREAVHRALALHASEFLHMERLRSRRSGRSVFVEVTLGFEDGLSLAEVHRRSARIRDALTAEIDRADVSILTTSGSL